MQLGNQYSQPFIILSSLFPTVIKSFNGTICSGLSMQVTSSAYAICGNWIEIENCWTAKACKGDVLKNCFLHWRGCCVCCEKEDYIVETFPIRNLYPKLLRSLSENSPKYENWFRANIDWNRAAVAPTCIMLQAKLNISWCKQALQLDMNTETIGCSR